jgi:oxygen-independent coproporphyrinogen-3 oxidase
MCHFRADLAALEAECGAPAGALAEAAAEALAQFPGAIRAEGRVLEIPHEGRPLTRMIARVFDAYAVDANGHSLAI